MPKILQICVEGNTGSTGTIAESIGQLAIQGGWKSYIAFGRFPRRSKSNLIRIGSDIQVLLHGLETRIFDNHAFSSRLATRKLVRKIEVIKPDIIHLHHLHGYYINIEVLFKYLRESGIPVVWTFHDCWAFTGHCAFFDHVGCDRWKDMCFECPQKNQYPRSLIMDRSSLNYIQKRKLFTSLSNMVIVSVSKWLDSLVAQSFLKYQEHTVIYNGVDVDLFKPSDNVQVVKSKYGLTDKFVLLGAATNWERRKGLEDFFFLSSLLEQDEIIVLVGLSKKQIRGLPPNIIGLNRTDSRQEMVDLYSSSDIFLNLSDEESFGLTSIEAMACGTPVIVYNRTALPEIVSEAGIIVEKGDFYSLKDAIHQLRRKGKMNYSDICRKHVLEQFNDQQRYSDYLNLYKQILRNANK
jgi:putative colanic acid biosynthesis glycosyltransferase